jgi:hypothetical protein
MSDGTVKKMEYVSFWEIALLKKKEGVKKDKN